jgi:hypothetical protein
MREKVFKQSAYGLALWLVVVVLAPDTRASAPEYIVDEQPAPASVEDERAPMEEVYPVEPPLPSVFPRLKKRLETTAPFWRDTQLRLHPRVYYFDRDRENANNSEALAYGGWLGYSSGFWRDRLRGYLGEALPAVVQPSLPQQERQPHGAEYLRGLHPEQKTPE